MLKLIASFPDFCHSSIHINFCNRVGETVSWVETMNPSDNICIAVSTEVEVGIDFWALHSVLSSYDFGADVDHVITTNSSGFIPLSKVQVNSLVHVVQWQNKAHKARGGAVSIKVRSRRL
uniref:Uncharacterized protein n=1 Tax=Lepeophtheirus salmonis TaxID=72036 RepID=A0A0K2VEM1_LEPSM